MLILKGQRSLVTFVKHRPAIQISIHLSKTKQVQKPHYILEVPRHCYKLLLLSYCGFYLILVLVKRVSIIVLVFRSVSFQVVPSFSPDAGKLWFLNFIYCIYRYHFLKSSFQSHLKNLLKQWHQLFKVAYRSESIGAISKHFEAYLIGAIR